MENSKKLLKYAIDALQEGGVPEDQWAIGGGTVLASIYNHRLSKDIDTFISDVQYLSALSPRFNNCTEAAFEYNEMSNYISLTFPNGKVDFIASPQITTFSPQKGNFLGEELRIEDPIEIVTKKLYFRGNQVLPRDIFDLAVVYESDRKFDLINSVRKIPDKMSIFFESFSEREKNPKFRPYTKEYGDMLLPGAKALIGNEFAICKDFIRCVQEIETILTKDASPIEKNKIEFFKAAQEVLFKDNNQWTSETNKKIIERLNAKGYGFRKIVNFMQASPVKERNMVNLVKKVECLER